MGRKQDYIDIGPGPEWYAEQGLKGPEHPKSLEKLWPPTYPGSDIEMFKQLQNLLIDLKGLYPKGRRKGPKDLLLIRFDTGKHHR